MFCRTIRISCSSSFWRWPVPRRSGGNRFDLPTVPLPPKVIQRFALIRSCLPEFDSPGSSIIQIITKPGTNTLHGNAFALYNKEALNSRSPLLAQSTRPAYKQELLNGNLSVQAQRTKQPRIFHIHNHNAPTQNAIYNHAC